MSAVPSTQEASVSAAQLLAQTQALSKFRDRLDGLITTQLQTPELAIAPRLTETLTEFLVPQWALAVALALPATQNPDTSPRTFTVVSCATDPAARSAALPCVPGDTLTAGQFQTWSHDTVKVWPLTTADRSLGWAIVQPNPTQALAVDTLERALQHTATALLQAQLWTQRQTRHHQQITLLERRNRLKSEFLANTSHELRTPLSSILGFTRLLQEQGLNPDNLRHQEYLGIIHSSGKHLLALLNDILDLSKIEANQMELHPESLDVQELCQVAIALVKEKANNKGLQLQLEIAPTVTCICADPLRLKQMLFNLLANAIKFTHHGTVGLVVNAVDGLLHFSVWDTGPGISPEAQQRLFIPYSQLETMGHHEDGTGLGLALTQKLAELQGGWVTVDSKAGQGSRFTISLPQNRGQPCNVPAAHQPCAQAAAIAPAPDPTASAGQPILLVEDNPHNIRLLQTYLKKLGHTVTVVQRGGDFWQVLEATTPALILMDVCLPDIDGLLLTQQLKENPAYQAVPVVMQTAMAMTGDRETCLATGADAYLSKPIDLDELATVINRLLGAAPKSAH